MNLKVFTNEALLQIFRSKNQRCSPLRIKLIKIVGHMLLSISEASVDLTSSKCLNLTIEIYVSDDLNNLSCVSKQYMSNTLNEDIVIASKFVANSKLPIVAINQ